MGNQLHPVFQEICDGLINKDKVIKDDYLSYKDFEAKVKEILSWECGIGTTVGEEIEWKTKEIVKLTKKGDR